MACPAAVNWSLYGVFRVSVGIAKLTSSGAYDNSFDGDGRVVSPVTAGYSPWVIQGVLDSQNRILVSGTDLLLDSRKMQRLTPSLRSLDAASGALQATVFPETSGPLA